MNKTVTYTVNNVWVEVHLDSDDIDYVTINDKEVNKDDFLELIEALSEFLPIPPATAPGIVGPWTDPYKKPLVTFNDDKTTTYAKRDANPYGGTLNDNSIYNGDQ